MLRFPCPVVLRNPWYGALSECLSLRSMETSVDSNVSSLRPLESFQVIRFSSCVSTPLEDAEIETFFFFFLNLTYSR